MLLTQQIINSLNWVECADRNFYEYGVPIAHCAIPQARQLQCLKFLAVLTLRADEPGCQAAPVDS